LRIRFLVLVGIGHGDCTAIDHFDFASMQQPLAGGRLFATLASLQS
jgi:hypothetical protein